MNDPETQYQQDGTRRPPVETPPHAWHDVEREVECAGHEPEIPGYPQTGTRKPPDTRTPPPDVYADIPEPPEEPPILTRPYSEMHPGRTPTPGEPPRDPHDHVQEHEHEHEHPGPGTGEQPSGETRTRASEAAPRQNQRNLTAATRSELHRRLRDYIHSSEDPVRRHFEQGHVHGTPQFLPWHRQFLEGFERWQRVRLADPGAFVPLAFWDPADSLPSEFAHEGRNASIPSMPLPDSLAMDRLSSPDYQAFSSIIEAYHNAVHDTIGGDMADPRVSPNDTCFWLFHAYLDNVFAEWEALRQASR
jgi:hypothetical protein